MKNEELTIRQLRCKIQDLEDDLELYLKLKQINYEKTQPVSTKIKEIVTSRTNTIFDKFTQYVIKDEEYDNIILAKHKSLIAYQERLLNKIENIKNSDVKTYITYLREDELLSWDDIEKETHYSKRQAQRIYKS